MAAVTVEEKKPMIKYDFQKCTFCKICELSCAEKHFGKYGDSLSRIIIVRKGPLMLRQFVCTRCDKLFCIAACPKKALSYEKGNIVVDTKLCDSCAKCVQACPFHGIKMHPQTKMPIICDLCGGDPECIKRCPKGALAIAWLPVKRQ